MENPVGSYHQVACENPSWFHCFSDGNMIGTVPALFSDFQFVTSCNLFTACFSFIEKFRPLFLCVYTVHLYIYICIYGLVLSTKLCTWMQIPQLHWFFMFIQNWGDSRGCEIFHFWPFLWPELQPGWTFRKRGNFHTPLDIRNPGTLKSLLRWCLGVQTPTHQVWCPGQPFSKRAAFCRFFFAFILLGVCLFWKSAMFANPESAAEVLFSLMYLGSV